MQVDIRSEPEGAAQEGVSGRDEHRSASRFGAGIDGGLQGRGVVGRPVTFSTEVHDVVHVGLLRLARAEQADAEQEEQQFVCLDESSHIKIGF